MNIVIFRTTVVTYWICDGVKKATKWIPISLCDLQLSIPDNFAIVIYLLCWEEEPAVTPMTFGNSPSDLHPPW